MFSFLNKTKKPDGYIALFNLEDWWNNSFSGNEQKHIVEVFQPLGASKDILIVGHLQHTNSDRPLMLLSSLAGWFNNSKDRDIAYKIIAKAEEYVQSTKDILDIHFFHQTKMEIFYKGNDSSTTLQKSINACLNQIEIADKASTAFQAKYHKLPIHKGYELLCTIYERQGKFEECIKLMEQAKNQGWNGDWDNHIKRIRERIFKLNRS